MIVFTDIDDMLLPLNPVHVRPNINVEILKVCLPQADVEDIFDSYIGIIQRPSNCRLPTFRAP